MTDETPVLATPFGREIYAKIFLLGAVFLAMHWWQLIILGNRWQEDNWQHGFLMPLFSLYLLYAKRHELFAARRRPCIWGLVLMALAMLLEVAGFSFNHYTAHFGMLLMAFGLVLYVGGPGVIRVTWVPIWFLLIAMPLPGQVYNILAYHFQEFAAAGAVIVLKTFGAVVTVEGSSMKLVSFSGNHWDLTVAEACSGVRSMMAYVALGAAFAFLEDRPVWQRAVLVLVTVPVAIVTNLLRVVITCYMYLIDRKDLGDGFMHFLTGLLMLIPALLLMMGVLWVINRVYVDDAEDEPDSSHGAPQAQEGQ